jgi:ribosome-associated protein
MAPRPIDPEDLEQAKEIRFEFYRSAGPGGQNVNKVATAVRLRFDLRRSSLLPAPVKERLTKLAGKRMTEGGFLVIESQRYRTQERNRADAMARLQSLLDRASAPPAVRRPTRPSNEAKARRVDEKRRHSRIKASRRERTVIED